MLKLSSYALQDLCKKYDIATAFYEAFIEPEPAKKYIRSVGAPIVVKASGLAAGKGVIVAQTIEEACTAVDDMLVNKAFGEAGTAYKCLASFTKLSVLFYF